MPENRTRVQLDFTAEALTQLDGLKDETSASSRADVVRFALRVLQWVLGELKSGGKILVEKDGQIQQVVFPFLSQVQKQPSEAAGRVEPVGRRIAVYR